jgi:hypothetical protein
VAQGQLCAAWQQRRCLRCCNHGDGGCFRRLAAAERVPQLRRRTDAQRWQRTCSAALANERIARHSCIGLLACMPDACVVLSAAAALLVRCACKPHRRREGGALRCMPDAASPKEEEEAARLDATCKMDAGHAHAALMHDACALWLHGSCSPA